MSKVYECSICGVVSHDSEQLCKPRGEESRHAYCGTAPERGTMCDSMRDSLPFVCAKCGRPAEQADLVCKPLVTG
jgi:hypothetical protein